jgi:hypothetical protein
MQTEIIKTLNGRLVLGTWDVSLLVELEHRLVKNTTLKFVRQISALGAPMAVYPKSILPVHRRNNGVGAPVCEYLLEAPQVKFLVSALPPRGRCVVTKIFVINNCHVPDTEFFAKLEKLHG